MLKNFKGGTNIQVMQQNTLGFTVIDSSGPIAVTNSPELLDSSKWLYHSGADKTEKCDILLSGASLHFTGNGARVLVSTDLDLSIARYGICAIVQVGPIVRNGS